MKLSAAVTVVIPFKNSKSDLRHALMSVLKQTHPVDQIFLIDDGSTDNSIDSIRDLLSPKVVLISDGESLGLASRLNESLNYVNTKYLARMDADDYMHPCRIKEQLEYLDKNPEVDVVSTGFYGFIKDEGTCKVVFNSEYDKDKELGLDDILSGGAVLHPSVLAQTSWFKKNTYDTQLSKCQDQDLWLRSISHSRIVRLKKPLMYYKFDWPLTVEKIHETRRCLLKIYFKRFNKTKHPMYLKKMFSIFIRYAFYKA